MAGLQIRPADRLTLGIDAAWNEADASLDAFDLDVPPEFDELSPVQSFDFTRTHTYSDLDTTRWEIGADADFRLNERFWLFGGYRYLDFDDGEPVLVDSDGSVDFYRLGLGWRF